ncbi:NADH dehydrogenase [ubiquinone] 1 alpha subcomplex subunit, partial [Lachnellula suecica]
MPQDLPPSGGYSAVQYKVRLMRALQRNLPARGFRPAVLLAGMAGVMTYGFWKLGKGIREQKYVYDPPARVNFAREKMWSRIHLIPLLTAEEDRDLVRRAF